MSFKKILCAIDFSESSHVAMMVAAQTALESGAALTLVHVWQPPILPRDSAALLADELHAELVTDCNTGLAKARALVEGVGAIKVEAKLLAGTAWDWARYGAGGERFRRGSSGIERGDGAAGFAGAFVEAESGGRANSKGGGGGGGAGRIWLRYRAATPPTLIADRVSPPAGMDPTLP
jgi:hypothetical protein